MFTNLCPIRVIRGYLLLQIVEQFLSGFTADQTSPLDFVFVNFTFCGVIKVEHIEFNLFKSGGCFETSVCLFYHSWGYQKNKFIKRNEFRSID